MRPMTPSQRGKLHAVSSWLQMSGYPQSELSVIDLEHVVLIPVAHGRLDVEVSGLLRRAGTPCVTLYLWSHDADGHHIVGVVRNVVNHPAAVVVAADTLLASVDITPEGISRIARDPLYRPDIDMQGGAQL